MAPRETPESASLEHLDRTEDPEPMEHLEPREHVDFQEVLVHQETSSLTANVF